jgi:hypothetical protein
MIGLRLNVNDTWRIQMKKQLLIALLLLVGQPIVRAQEHAIALLTEIHGPVLVRSRDTRVWKTIKTTTPLFDRDAVKVQSSGKALLLQGGSSARTLKPGDAVVVSKSKLWFDRSRGVMEPKSMTSLLALLDQSASTSLSRPTAVRGLVDLLFPRNEKVIDARPTFKWTSPPGKDPFKLELFRAETLVWTTRTSQKSIAYPKNLPPLPAGNYRWKVSDTGISTDSDETSFEVLSPSLTTQLRSNIQRTRSLVPANQANLPLITLYMDNGLLSPAATEIDAAINRKPQDKILARFLEYVQIYVQRKQRPE